MGSAASKPVKSAAGAAARRQYPKQAPVPPRVQSTAPKPSQTPQPAPPTSTPSPSQAPGPISQGPKYHSKEQPSGTRSNGMYPSIGAQEQVQITERIPLNVHILLSLPLSNIQPIQPLTSTVETPTSPPPSDTSAPSTPSQPSPTPAPSTAAPCRPCSHQPRTRPYSL
jgi:hypothetical protein